LRLFFGGENPLEFIGMDWGREKSTILKIIAGVIEAKQLERLYGVEG